MDITYVKTLLRDWFSYPKQKLFCQVATMNQQQPHLRTMDLYHITDQGQLILLTDTSTRKWADLQICPKIAICLLNQDRGQILVEGTVTLKSIENDFNITNYYWNHFVEEYWQNLYFSRTKEVIKGIPTAFGVIIVKPNLWEILELNQEDFLSSAKNQYHFINGTWEQKTLMPSS